MRHRVGQRKLGRVTEHRIAMLRNQAEALITHEHIETTRAQGEGAAARSSSGSSRSPSAAIAAGDANGRALHARRMVLRDIQDRDVVSKLFDTIAPRFAARPGGYTRILRLGYRRGDSAEVAQIELVGSEYNPNAEAEKAETPDRAEAEGRGRPPARGGRAPARQGQAGGRREPAATTTPRRRKPSPSARTARAARPTPAARAPRPRRRARRAARNVNDCRTAEADRSAKAGRFAASGLSSCTAHLPSTFNLSVFSAQTSSAASAPRSAFDAAMILACRCDGTSS